MAHCNGNDICAHVPHKCKFIKEFDTFLKAQLPEGVLPSIEVEYLPENREAIPDTVYNEIHIECHFIGGAWYIKSAWDWALCEIQTLSEMNQYGVPKEIEAKDIPESFWKELLGYCYESHEQQSYPCNGTHDIRFKKKRLPWYHPNWVPEVPYWNQPTRTSKRTRSGVKKFTYNIRGQCEY